jgi:hypothetical protein
MATTVDKAPHREEFDIEGGDVLRKLERNDPRYADGSLKTKFVAEEIDLEHLEHSNLYFTYLGKEETQHHKLRYNFRSSFNNAEHGLNFWFMDAYAKIKTKNTGGAWTARAILNPNAYFLLAYRQKFDQQFALKVGVETEVGQTTRHFWKFSKGFNAFKFTTMLSGDLALPKKQVEGQRVDGPTLVDTLSLIPSYKVKYVDPTNPLKKVKVGLVVDLDLKKAFDKNREDKSFPLKRELKLRSSVKYNDGAFYGEFDLGRSTNADLRVFHNINKSFGLYLSYLGALRNFEGLKTFGWQIRVPDFGKIRTSIDSNWMLKNSFIYRAHPFASIVQFTQFNVKQKSNLHFGLALALGN